MHLFSYASLTILCSCKNIYLFFISRHLEIMRNNIIVKNWYDDLTFIPASKIYAGKLGISTWLINNVQNGSICYCGEILIYVTINTALIIHLYLYLFKANNKMAIMWGAMIIASGLSSMWINETKGRNHIPQ